MARSVAVAVIHGIGSQGREQPADSAIPTFSKNLFVGVRNELGRASFDDAIAWREIFYSDITQENQDTYFGKVKRRLSFDSLREFAIKNLGDAASYRLDRGDVHNRIYERIHERVTETVTALKADTAPDAPLVVLAHSLGGHVMSNYIWDAQGQAGPAPDMSAMNTVAAMITFGCNIPLFTFAWAPEHIKAIADPGTGLPSALRQKPWWRNYFDKDDVLGYPLVPIGTGYEELHARGELRDHKINAGGIFTSWNPFSHNQYWGDFDLIRPVANILGKLVRAV